MCVRTVDKFSYFPSLYERKVKIKNDKGRNSNQAAEFRESQGHCPMQALECATSFLSFSLSCVQAFMKRKGETNAVSKTKTETVATWDPREKLKNTPRLPPPFFFATVALSIVFWLHYLNLEEKVIFFFRYFFDNLSPLKN